MVDHLDLSSIPATLDAHQVISLPSGTFLAAEIPDPIIIAEWSSAEIAALRIGFRMSLVDFASFLGVTQRSVSKWEKGERVGGLNRSVHHVA